MSSRAQKQGLAHDPAGAQLPGEACSLGSKQRERVRQSIFCRYVQSQGKLTGMKNILLESRGYSPVWCITGRAFQMLRCPYVLGAASV